MDNSFKSLRRQPETHFRLPTYLELQDVRRRVLTPENTVSNIDFRDIQEIVGENMGREISPELADLFLLNEKPWTYTTIDNDLPLVFASFDEGQPSNLNDATGLIIVNRNIIKNVVQPTSVSLTSIHPDLGGIPRVISANYNAHCMLDTIDVGIYEDEFETPYFPPEENMRHHSQVTRPIPTPNELKTSSIITPAMARYNTKMKALHLFFPNLADQTTPFHFYNEYMFREGYDMALIGNHMQVNRRGHWELLIPTQLGISTT